jgi:hypothetical protein
MMYIKIPEHSLQKEVSDLDLLYADLGMAGETQDDVMHSVCNPVLPKVEGFDLGC